MSRTCNISNPSCLSGNQNVEVNWIVGEEKLTNYLGKGMDYGGQERWENPFNWHSVKLNLPSSSEYIISNPLFAKIWKYRHIESEVLIYVDDMRLLGR